MAWTPLELLGFSWLQWLGAGLIFVFGGTVKGTMGVGLPLVSVPMLSLLMPPPVAMALVAIPVLASNIWQAIETRHHCVEPWRFFPLCAALVAGTFATIPLTLSLPVPVLNAMLSGAVLLSVALMVFSPAFRVSSQYERPVGIGVGLVSGVLGGVSSLTGPIIISFLMSLKLKREEFVGYISVIYLCGAIPLYLAMALHGRLTGAHLLMSLLATGPLVLGLLLGKFIRGHISEQGFRFVLIALLTVISVVLLFK